MRNTKSEHVRMYNWTRPPEENSDKILISHEISTGPVFLTGNEETALWFVRKLGLRTKPIRRPFDSLVMGHEILTTNDEHAGNVFFLTPVIKKSWIYIRTEFLDNDLLNTIKEVEKP